MTAKRVQLLSLEFELVLQKDKLKIYRNNVLSILMYVAECWKINKRDESEINRFHNGFLRITVKIYLAKSYMKGEDILAKSHIKC